MDFSPLTSPAMVPHQENHNYQGPPSSQPPPPQRHQQQQHHHHQQPFPQCEHHQAYPTSTSSSETLQFKSANDINDQYEELEKTKMMITRRLSELEKQQMTSSQGANNTTISNQGNQRTPRNPTTYITEYSDRKLYIWEQGSLLLLNFLYTYSCMHIVVVISLGAMSTYSNSLSGVFQQQVRLEPVTPASLMNLRQHERQRASSFPHQGGIMAHEFNTTMHMNNCNNDSGSYPASSSASPSAMTTSPPPPPASKRGKRKARQPSLSSDHQTTKTANRRSSSAYDKQQHPAIPTSQQNRTHASPRALKPLLISPALKPNQHQPLTPINQSPTTNHEAERILATRSNYQNLMEGKAAALGIAFTPQIKSGIEVRRTAHKAAEQKRRDSLKEWFDRLRLEVEEGYVKKRSGLKSKVIREQQREGGVSKRQRSDDDDDGEDVDDDVLKPLSKVLLLRYAYDYITHLKDTLAERDALIGTLTKEDASSFPNV